ncbi:MAG: hypothetical protein Harvfovirus57_9 [Harvfovirus sp.]|uniref:Uncharacterized protein n=1 Tax=Harvfovirus sp. TaxID=2487768 RepID=A0A3G5A3I5_9VIRU|nr:MAG: hypothetical protein Harvfovirus57_9 [Harvfovirus sp.]
MNILKISKKLKIMTAQEEGFVLEELIHDRFGKYGIKCFREAEIKKTYGETITALDHLLSYGDRIILLQDKYRNSAPDLASINHFNHCVDEIKLKHPGTEISAMYVSKKAPTRPALISLNYKGNKSISNNGKDSKEDLIDLLEPHVLSFFKILDEKKKEQIKKHDEQEKKVNELLKSFTEQIRKMIEKFESAKNRLPSNYKTMIDDHIVRCNSYIKDQSSKTDICKISKDLCKMLEIYEYSTSANYNEITVCLQYLSSVVDFGKQLNTIKNDIIFKSDNFMELDGKHWILAFKFCKYGDYKEYGLKNWKKLKGKSNEELNNEIGQLIKNKKI